MKKEIEVDMADARITLRRPKFGALLYSNPNIFSTNQDDDINSRRNSNATSPSPRISSGSSPSTASPSPYSLSPWNQPSPYMNSPWIQAYPIQPSQNNNCFTENGLIGSLIREEGHVYSIAASDAFLYTGSDSKNIRVWKSLKEFSGFKSSSGLVKAIIVFGSKIFTGHQDGKIRVWKYFGKKRKAYSRIGTLPTTKDYLKTSINPNNYVPVRRNRKVPWIRHFDAVSCMSLDEEQGILYSGSWDKTVKVWRISDFKCLESIKAHDDAVNSVAVGFDGLIFTGSADGTVKGWRRELVGKATKHVLVQTLLEQDSAVTSLAINKSARVVYSGSSDGMVNFWKREKHFLSYGGILRGHKLAVLCLAVAGSLVLSGSADKTICVWRTEKEDGGVHKCVSVLTGHEGPVKCLTVEENSDHETENYAVREDGRRRWIAYSGSLDRSVKVWTVSEQADESKQPYQRVRAVDYGRNF